MPATVESTTLAGHDAVRLGAGDYATTFLPSLGMVGASLRWRGDELVAFDPAAYAQGHTSGIPLLHPWANRLSTTSYTVGDVRVTFPPEPPVHVLDGLAIHGTMTARPGWSVTEQRVDGDRAHVVARFAFDAPDLLRSFPFPHDLDVAVTLHPQGLEVATTVHATGGCAVPVSFGWHPYLALPGVAREELTVGLPDRTGRVLDERMIPTGATVDDAREEIALGRPGDPDAVTFDHAYRLHDDRRLWFADARRQVSVMFDSAYPEAQVWAPAGRVLVCLEPMTAPVDALVTGSHRTVPAGGADTAIFTISATDRSS